MDEVPEFAVLAINIGKRMAVSTIGLGVINSFLDDDDEETQDASIAKHATIKWDAGGWSCVLIEDFTESVN